ncbi:iron hydrogenase small subunit [Anaerostipes sp.]
MSQENEQIKRLYEEFYVEPLSELAEQRGTVPFFQFCWRIRG